MIIGPFLVSSKKLKFLLKKWFKKWNSPISYFLIAKSVLVTSNQ